LIYQALQGRNELRPYGNKSMGGWPPPFGFCWSFALLFDTEGQEAQAVP
jgi:hypothetical protein